MFSERMGGWEEHTVPGSADIFMERTGRSRGMTVQSEGWDEGPTGCRALSAQQKFQLLIACCALLGELRGLFAPASSSGLGTTLSVTHSQLNLSKERGGGEGTQRTGPLSTASPKTAGGVAVRKLLSRRRSKLEF